MPRFYGIAGHIGEIFLYMEKSLPKFIKFNCFCRERGLQNQIFLYMPILKCFGKLRRCKKSIQNKKVQKIAKKVYKKEHVKKHVKRTC